MVRESDIEDTVCARAENMGFVRRKMAYAGRRGCRDDDIYGFGHSLKIEFKRPGKGLDPHQEREAQRLAQVGVHVYVIDSIERGFALLDWAKANPVKEARFPG